MRRYPASSSIRRTATRSSGRAARVAVTLRTHNRGRVSKARHRIQYARNTFREVRPCRAPIESRCCRKTRHPTSTAGTREAAVPVRRPEERLAPRARLDRRAMPETQTGRARWPRVLPGKLRDVSYPATSRVEARRRSRRDTVRRAPGVAWKAVFSPDGLEPLPPVGVS
jgi:hypothetical protein